MVAGESAVAEGEGIIQLTEEQTERLQTRTASRVANAAISAISSAAADVNITEQTIT